MQLSHQEPKPWPPQPQSMVVYQHAILAIHKTARPVFSMTSKCRNGHRLLDLKLLSQSPSRSPRLGTFYLRALDHMFDSTLCARSSFGVCLCTTSSRCILQTGSLPVGCVVSIVLICQPASRGNGILHSDPPSQTTTSASSPYCIHGRQDCWAGER